MADTNIRTSDRLTKEIIEICEKINTAKVGQLGYVHIEVETGCRLHRCFANVMSKFEKDGD
jgi:hypothetical protein